MTVYDRAKSFMRASGNLTQWAGAYPAQADVEADVAAGNLYVAEDAEGRVVMVFAFIPGEDPTYNRIDGAWLNDDDYGTIHRIATDGSVARCFDRAVGFCLSRTDNIRIDTHRDNRPMLKALRRAGFTRCGVIICADGTPREAFQMVKR
ncbi:MAG: GNAT family N-acetyltransferase [Muribaculaceae bacterium]|nr:GNAT family N-acetyltransferase [Muribaculaceae bacterium]